MANIKKLTAILLSAVLILVLAIPALAAANMPSGTASKGTNMQLVNQPLYVNPDTNYAAYIEDDADLLTSTEERELLDYMWQITEHGHVVFKTIDANPYSSTQSFAENYYYGIFGNSSGTMFIIDMDQRMIYICSAGKVYQTVTKGRANTITDNTYSYAKAGDYAGCAKEAFLEIQMILMGNQIAQPMKHISNLLLAVMIALLINFIIIMRAASLHRKQVNQLIQAAEASVYTTGTRAKLVHTTKKYSPQSSSSSGGGGGGGFSGGGGGGFSGGGGGHSF